jgi:hypothetical protein
MIATARSTWAWLFDYDPLIVYLHALIREVVLSAETPRDFVEAFRAEKFGDALKAVASAIPGDERGSMIKLLRASQSELYADYMRRLTQAAGPNKKTFDWLQNEGHYRYIRALYKQGRIQAIKGNLLTNVAVPAISASAKKLGVPIRIFYTSNADDKWEINPRYRDNLLSVPYDDRGVWIRTVFPRKKGRNPNEKWEYVIHDGKEAQRKLAREGWSWTWYFDEDGHPGAPANVVAIGLPGRTEREREAK